MNTQEAPSNPAGDALREELRDIMGNPQNPLHAGYHRNDPAVHRQIDEKYQKVYGTKPVDLGGFSAKIGGERKPADADNDPEAAERQALADAAVKEVLGDTHDADLPVIQAEVKEFLSTQHGPDAMRVLEQYLDPLGPKGEALTVRFFRDLAALRKGQ